MDIVIVVFEVNSESAKIKRSKVVMHGTPQDENSIASVSSCSGLQECWAQVIILAPANISSNDPRKMWITLISIQLEAQIANIVRQALLPSVQRLTTGKKMLCEYSGVTG